MDRRPIGICDSGVGGITVARVLHELYPRESLLFLGDSARNPYGDKPPEVISAMAEELKQFLLRQNVKMIIAACNTITFNVPPSFYEGDVPVQGMCLSLPETAEGGISVFATPATIRTHRYRDFIRKRWPKADIREIPFDGLAAAIEQKRPKEELMVMIRETIAQFHVPDKGQAILACTHYPLVKDLFCKALPHTAFHDPALATVRAAMERLEAQDALTDTAGSSVFYFTKGAENAKALVQPLFGQVPVKPAAVAGV